MTPDELSLALTSALHGAVDDGSLALDREKLPAKVIVERPKNRAHGDWASNIAMQLAKPAGRNPRELAAELSELFSTVPGVRSVDVAGPGFLNFTLDAAAVGELARVILAAGSAFGTNDELANQGRINLEFVSANPTGPLHLAHTRWAAVGDSLARVLRASGASVATEYYINDAGNQMNKFAQSVLAAMRGEPTPEGGYPGQYITDLAQRILADDAALAELPAEEALPRVRERAYELEIAEIRRTLEEFGVHFDTFFSEQTLHDGHAVEDAIDRLRAQGHVFDADGAVWLSTTDFGDDKDRVLVRSGSEPTYFAADAAYYLSKKDRGFDQKIYLLGADHHGYINRLRAISACAGDDPDVNIEILIGQMVSVNGARLSKRAGNIVELTDLLKWLGADALRYSLERSPTDSPLALDAEQLRSASNDNPVFYVQYAHARTRAVARNAESAGVGSTKGTEQAPFDASELSHSADAELLAALGAYPRVVAEAARLREVHRVARHLETIAGTYHRWYDATRVTPKTGESVNAGHQSRLWLNDATGQVLANGLGLLGVSAPERM